MSSPIIGRVYEHRNLRTFMPRPWSLVVVDGFEDDGEVVLVRVPGKPIDDSQAVPSEGFSDDYELLTGSEQVYAR